MRGTRELRSLPEARLLLDFTTATIIVAVDNVRGERLAELWRRVRELATNGDAEGAIALVHETLRRGPGEEQRVREFCSRAIELGELWRFEIFGFDKPDIVEYLDHRMLVPESKSWADLRKRHNNNGGKTDFKRWLTDELGGTFDDEALAAACDALDSVPDDLVRLANLCRRTGRLDVRAGRTAG